MKSPLTLLLFVLLGVSLLSTILIAEGSIALKKEVERQAVNFNQIGRENQSLILSNEEIKTELEKKNSTIAKTDSLLKAKDKKISQLEKVIATGIIIVDYDTVYVETKPPVVVVTQKGELLKTEFTDTKSCITVAGFVLSTDSFPSIAITQRKADLKVYDIRIKRRWFEYWKPKYERYIETECGQAEIIEIEKMK